MHIIGSQLELHEQNRYNLTQFSMVEQPDLTAHILLFFLLLRFHVQFIFKALKIFKEVEKLN